MSNESLRIRSASFFGQGIFRFTRHTFSTLFRSDIGFQFLGKCSSLSNAKRFDANFLDLMFTADEAF